MRVLVFITASTAVACWALAEVRRSRVLWTLGAGLLLVHSLAAMAVFYGWSHAEARRITAAQTAALTGSTFEGGIYVNYAFLAVWLADVVWWWTSPATYATRGRAVSGAVHGFLFFIILNGAVIFADGSARIVGSIAVTAVACSWLLAFRSPARVNTLRAVFFVPAFFVPSFFVPFFVPFFILRSSFFVPQ